ncbi:hypothetical protein AYK24_04090 [Thermoplasmatales archaeon SG8-52-4]|nr:MAG: hypothetical protein AYK24_04090 [Thermoplasmatales archaeon SG8-52-4]
MKTKKMNKLLVINIITLLIGTFFIPLSFGESNYSTEPVIITVNQSGEEIKINYEINDFSESIVMIEGVQYSIINIGEESNLLQTGKPDIPNICRSVIIPDTANMKVNVIKSTYADYKNVLIAPSKGNLLRSVNPNDISYEFDELYNKDAWFPNEIAYLRDPYLLRDYRAQVVEIYPIQYNPVKKIMRFYDNIKIEIVKDGENSINCIYRENLPTVIDTDFEKIYENHFINFEKLGRYDPVGEQGNLLIICYDDFIDEMQPFVEWKIMKGIPTEIKKVSEIGNADDIKTYIANYYNDYGLTFILLVGDEAQVPTLTASTHASDPSYTYIVGDDHYPDLFIGRFSAQNSDQVITQVERSVEYEKTPQEGAYWYKNGTGIGSSQGPGDDGEMDYEHLRNIRNNKLYPYTYIWGDELYDGTQGGDDAAGNPTPGMVSDAVNNGRSVINYCGHGSPSGWGSSGFSTSDINSLTNDNMLPYVICVACNNGQFDDYDECFCEAWLRATNNGEPAGAITATGSTKSMGWNPPMDAQDEMMDLMVESYTDNIRHTIGGIHYNGVMHMNDEYGSSGYAETDTWHVFGDPSLQIRTDTPVGISVIRDDEIEEDALSYEVTVTDVEGALCAISRNNELIGYAYTDETGYALIEFNEPILGNDPCAIVVTAYNKIPYIDILPVNVNKPPEVPDKPTGPATGKPNEELTFTAITTDPEADQVYYMWRWGDGDYSEWLGPFNSGEAAQAMHSWDSPSNYQIRVKAKDIWDQETDWSEGFFVSITKTKTKNLFFFNLLEYLQNTFPLLCRLLNLQ